MTASKFWRLLVFWWALPILILGMLLTYTADEDEDPAVDKAFQWCFDRLEWILGW